MDEELDRLLSTIYHEAHHTTYEAPASQIKATAGLGKTHEVIKALAESNDWRSCEVHYFAPDHDQAAEVAKLAQSCDLRGSDATLDLASHACFLTPARPRMIAA